MRATSIRVRLAAVFAALVLGAPTTLAEPPEVFPIDDTPVEVTPNEVPAVIARPPAPIALVESGGGYVAAGGIVQRVQPSPNTYPDLATEQSALRTEYSTVVQNPDGTATQTLSLGRINFQDRSGDWQPIDVRLISRLAGEYDLGIAANDVDLRISSALGADRLVELVAGEAVARLRVPGFSAGTVSSTADRISFDGAGSDPTFEILPTPEGFEFTVVINDPSQIAEARVALQTVNLTTVKRDDGTIEFLDAQGAVVGHITAPTILDATGAIAPPEAVAVDLLKLDPGEAIRDLSTAVEPDESPLAPAPGIDVALNVVRANEVVITYAVADAWLKAPERVFPVVIDPSVCIAYGSGTGCQGATGTRDVWISLAQPNLSPTAGPLRAGYDGATYSTTRSEMYFPDVALTDGDVVTSATLQVTTQGGYSNRTLKVAPLTQPWPFGNGTWNNQPPHDVAATQAFTPPGSAGAMTMDISPIVRGWYSRSTATWKPNSGLKLHLADESTSCVSTAPCYRMYFYALDGTASQRPKLTINYTNHQARVDFDTSLGTDFAPSTMPAGADIHVPVTVKNAGSGFPFTACGGATTNCYKVGYRWFDSLGKLMTFTGATGTANLAATLASGSTSATIDLSVKAPPNAGQYTLRFDLMWMWNGIAVGASDYADPSKYYARAKDPLAQPTNVRWVGTSKLARSEFPIAVVAGGGTGVGETKTVSLPDGSSLGVNLWSKNLRFDGSGGVGFDDLGTSLGLSYYYDSANRTDCATSILGACGWGTNYDEGFLPGANGADWIYRDPDGNRFAVDANTNGQLTSGAGVRLDRPRATIIEDNNLTGWTGGAVTRSTSQFYAGGASISIATNGGYSMSAGFRPIDLSHYILGSAAIKSTAATGVGIGFHITNESTGASGWLYYTIGTDFAIAGVTKIALGGTITGAWNATALDQRSVLYDAYSNGFGGTYDHYVIDNFQVRGNGTAGTAYFDSIRFEGRGSQIFSDLGGGQPAWTANSANATANTSDKVVGANSIQIAPTTIALSPTCANCLTGSLPFYPYLHWAWKKVGGTTIAYVLQVKNMRTLATGTLTYYAGNAAPAGAVNPIQISASIPDHWIYVTRNLLEDARSVLGWYDDHNTSGTSTGPSGGPTPDDVQLTGYVLVSSDGAYGLFDNGSLRTLPDTGEDWGATTGSEFTATYSGGTTHYFDREGRLTAIKDLDGNETILNWDYATDGLSEALVQIIAPGDGDALTSGTAQREIILTSTGTYVRFGESLGISGGSTQGRYTEIQRTVGGNVTAVIPARRSAACAVSGASGCLEFTYDTGSYLARVDDPRDTGTFRTSITWHATNHTPDTITSLASPSTVLFRVKSWDAATGWQLRPQYQDSNGVATGTNGYARHDDLSPNGSVLIEYAPVACTSANCGAAPAPFDKLVEYKVDGIDNYSTEIRYRTTGNGNPVTTRRGTFAAAKVDNFPDPLTAGLTAWTQSADQYAASSGPDFLTYRTTYTYNEFGQVTRSATPFTNPAGGTSTQTALTVYDAEGHVIQSSDAAFVNNPGFESQVTGWSGTGTWTQTAPASGIGALQMTGSQTKYQNVQLLPGQTFRFQAKIKAASGSSTGYKIDYETTPGVYAALLAYTTDSATTWKTLSFDVTVPQTGTGGIRITFQVGGGVGTAYADDVAVFTLYAGTAYLTNGRVDAETDVLANVTKYGYVVSTIHPAIFPTSVTRNYVSGQPALADQNVVSSSTYDEWGRSVSETDPDSVTTETVYASNDTDVATTKDGLDNTTTFLYDAIGHRTSIDDPVHPAATTTYTYLGDPDAVTAADGTVTKYAYDGVGRQTSVTLNYVGDGSDVSGAKNVKTTQVNDQFGNVTRTIADAAGLLPTSDVYTDATYDLFGQVVTRVVYENGTSTPRTTTAFFNTAGRATGSQGPIIPTAGTAPICPPSGSTKCNAVAVLDMNGRQLQATDAYGKLTKTWYDFAGQPIREIRNWIDGVYSSGDPDGDIVTTSRYDPAGHIVALTDVLNRTTSTTYDQLDRVITVTRADQTWIKTAYLPSGRVDRVSRAGAYLAADTTVAWTKNLYDGAGRQTTTVTDYDISGDAQFDLTSFEGGDAEGFGTGSNLFIATGATVSSSSVAATGAKARHIVTSAATKNQGISYSPPGTFQLGRTYKAVVWAKGAAAGQSWGLYLGHPSAGNYAEVQATSNGTTWQRIEVSWTPATDYVTGVLAAFRGNREQFTANTLDIDDVQVWDTGTPTRAGSTTTAFDAANQVTATIAAPGHPGEAPQVTTSAYDTGGRLTSITINAIAGAGTGSPDVNLTTAKAYDALGDLLSETDPEGVVTRYSFDRGGRVIASTLNYDAGVMFSDNDDNVTSKVGYNDRGEVTVICAAQQVQGDNCDPAGAPTTGWRYTYDAAGHVATDTPPDNVGQDLVTTYFTYDTANGGARLTSACEGFGTNCATVTRHTDSTYDDLGRVTQAITYQGSGTGSPKVRTVTSYDGAGQRTGLDLYENGSGTAADTLTFVYDLLGRETNLKRSGADVTVTTYNPDGTPATRKDVPVSATAMSFLYNLRGNLISADSPLLSDPVTYAWRLDGLLDARNWPTGTNAGTLTYDGAKRPTQLAETASGSNLAVFGRTYDRNGTVASETQTVSGISGDAGNGTQTFTYDPLRRVTGTAFGVSGTTKSYTYDANSNRVTQVEGGYTATTTVDRTGVARTVAVDSYTATFVGDDRGNLTTSFAPTPLALDPTAPAVPTSLVATANGRTRADLTWSASTDNVSVTSYSIYRDSALVMTVAGTVTAWSDFSLSPGTTYTYTLKANDAAGNASTTSSSSQATTQNGSPGSDGTAPSVPSGLSASPVTSRQLNVTWTASTDNVGVHGYRVYRDTVLVATVGTNSFSDVGLGAGSLHTYTVAAIDGSGNASAQSSSANGTAAAPVRQTAYAYDFADRLTGITPAAGPAVTLTLDALGRHKTRLESGLTDTYTYVGESASIVRIASSSGGYTNSVVDSTGARLAVTTPSGFAWTLSDLHGNVAGYATSAGGVVTDATRYDPFGEVVAKTSSSLPSPWGYQGRLDLAAAADTDLLDFGFRPYAPDLGTYTSPDDQAGKALNPLTFNRYLYAGANPATMVDPDGHCFVLCDIDIDPFGFASDLAGNVVDFGTGMVEGVATAAVDTVKGVVGAGMCAVDAVCRTTTQLAIANEVVSFGKDFIRDRDAALGGVVNTIGGAAVDWAKGTVNKISTAWNTGDFHTLGTMAGEATFAVGSAIATGGAIGAIRAGTSVAGGIAGAFVRAGQTVAGLGRVAAGAGRTALAAAEGLGGRLGAAIDGFGARTELVQRWMSRAELAATIETGLVRAGKAGTHFVTNAANKSAARARQRLALPKTQEVRVTLEVPAGVFSAPTKVKPNFRMLGGGMERMATGPVPCRVVCVSAPR